MCAARLRHVRAVADLDHQRVEVEHRVERLERAGLPLLDLFQDGVGDVGDRLVGQLGTQRGGQVVLNVADRHPAGVQADDHVLQPAQAARTLGHQRRRERGVAVARLVKADVADLGAHRLGGGAVARVPRAVAGPVALLVAQVTGQLGLHPPLEDGLDHLRQEPALTSQRQSTLIGGGHQLVQHVVAEQLTPQPPSLRLRLILLLLLLGHLGPFRRLREHRNRPDGPGNDLYHSTGHPLTAFFLMHVGPVAPDGTHRGFFPNQWAAEGLLFGPTGYDMPPAAHLLAATDYPAIQHRFSHGHRPAVDGSPQPEDPDGGVEIYYRTSTFLLTAGGVFLNSGYGHDDLTRYKQVAVTQSTTLMPTRADLTFDELIRFDWALYTDDIDAQRQGVNTSVHLGFACGANLHIPAWMFDNEAVPVGPWIVVNLNRSRPDRGRLGIYLAIYVTPTDGPETAWGDNLGLIHAVEATATDDATDAAQFDAFERATLDLNPDLRSPLHIAVTYEFHTADGHHITFSIEPTSNRYRSRIHTYDNTPQPVDLGKLPLADGQTLNPPPDPRATPYLQTPGGHDGYVEIRHPGCSSPLVLNHRDPQHPTRIDNTAMCPGFVIDLAAAHQLRATGFWAAGRITEAFAAQLERVRVLRGLVTVDRAPVGLPGAGPQRRVRLAGR